MSQLVLIIHCVWSTKKRIPFLQNAQFRYALYAHIREYSKSKNILVDHVGGYTDHIHVLLFLKSNQNIADVVKLLKGESSYWYSRMQYGNLLWQDDFYAVSVSPDRLNTVRRYIQRQVEHHTKGHSFNDEYESIKKQIHT